MPDSTLVNPSALEPLFLPWEEPAHRLISDPKSTDPSKRFPTKLTVPTGASEISVFQISISTDFSQPQSGILPAAVSTIGKRND